MRGWRLLLALPLAYLGTTAFTGPCGCDTDVMIASHGYTPLKPPSNLLQPGSIVAITHRRPFQAALICGPRASLGPNWKPQESPTSSQMTSKMNGKDFKVEASMMEAIRADARFSQVQSITATLNHARIVELRDEDVIRGQAERSEDCTAAIHSRMARGYRITMISSALSGDAVWQVRFATEAHLEGRAKLDMMDQLAIELGGNATSVTESEIRANDLVWGIKDDAYLVSLGLPDELMPTPDNHDPAAGFLTRDLGRARILPIPDAPVVAPSSYRQSLDGFEDNSEDGVRYYRQPTLTLPEGAPIFDPRHRPPRELPRQYILPSAPPLSSRPALETERSQSL